MSSLFNDPKILEAKQLLISALNQAKQTITTVKPPCATLQKSYEETLEALNQARGNPLYYPYIGSGLGNGALVELLDGSVKYDFICGIGAAYLGHSNPLLLESSIDAALIDTVMQGNLQQTIDPLHLMQQLIQASGMDHCFLSSSGAMATENSLKVAFHYKKTATRVLAFDNCFMGRTLSLSQITDKAAYRSGLPLNLPVDYIPFYKDEQSITTSVEILKKHLYRYPGQHGAMCCEMIQGEGGVHVGTHHFFKALMQVLKQHDIPIIADEIQTFGRTDKLFAFDYFDLREWVDIVCLGKLSQVCATLFKDRLKPGVGLLSQTFTASTAAIKASLTILEGFLKGDYLQKNAACFKECSRLIQKLKAKYSPRIEGPFGAGSMVAFIVDGGDPEKTTRFAKDLFHAGVITFIAGTSPMKIRMLLPAPVLKEGDLDKAFLIIEQLLERG
jgi:acetylornithine aminotransferase